MSHWKHQFKSGVQSKLHKVGAFLGVWSKEEEDKERKIWDKKVQTKIMNGQFGIPSNPHLFNGSSDRETRISNQVKAYTKRVAYAEIDDSCSKTSHELKENSSKSILTLDALGNDLDIDDSELYDSYVIDSSDEESMLKDDENDETVTSCDRNDVPDVEKSADQPLEVKQQKNTNHSHSPILGRNAKVAPIHSLEGENVIIDMNYSALCSGAEDKSSEIVKGHAANKKVTFVDESVPVYEDNDMLEKAEEVTLAFNTKETEEQRADGHIPADEEERKSVEGKEVQIGGTTLMDGRENDIISSDSTEAEVWDTKDVGITFTYGTDAYKHYSLFVQVENKVKVKELMRAKEKIEEKINWRMRLIDDIISKARAYYRKPSGKAEREWKELKQSIRRESKTNLKSHTNIRYRLANLHEHWPVFTIVISVIVAIGILCGLGDLTTIGFEPELQLLSGVQTFHGKETVHRWSKPNVWIGPSERNLIGLGAFFAPCMRDDFGIQLNAAQLNYSREEPLGCCEMSSRNSAGTTTEQECAELTNGAGTWNGQYTCASRPSGQNSVLHNMKPCCTDLKGSCLQTTHAHCIFLGGFFHKTGKENCRQVNCLESVCKPGTVQSDTERSWLPANPAQWWRLPLSLVYHQGIVHTALVVLVQLLMVSQIERTIGWLRVLIMYLVSGVAGLIVASMFTPYTPHVGSTGSLFGMVGLLLTELIHYWQVIRKPVVELVKLISLLCLFLLSGTLPYLDNFSMLTGLVTGVLTACILLPYISLGKAHTRCRILFISLCSTIIVILYFIILYSFFKVQVLKGCEICRKINCVPYTELMCADLS